jgi:hypothetical protein
MWDTRVWKESFPLLRHCPNTFHHRDVESAAAMPLNRQGALQRMVLLFTVDETNKDESIATRSRWFNGNIAWPADQ